MNKGLRFYVIDDNRSLRNMMQRVIKLTVEPDKLQFIREFNSALEAYDFLHNCPASLNPDIILCDFLMQGMTGLEFLKHLREDPDLKETPFIFTTVVNQKIEVEKALALGVTHYFIKPFSYKTLQKGILEIMKTLPTSPSSDRIPGK